ncbi:MAG TPA: ABC transporter ATP-binding protein, partial [Planctomycetota bacterium]|nr:ABC transporter ATP-binding protein [Planctomycetota bacterium]
MSEFLRVQDLVKDYPSGDSTLRVLKGISVELHQGQVTAIVGPSGAGKSTLLHLMGFLDRPSAGDVHWRGRSLSGMSGIEQDQVRNRHFGFVFQMYHLLPELTALENVSLPLMIRHSTGEWMGRRRELLEKSRALLSRLGLGGRLHHRPSQLSGGERQRVALARALIGDPEIVFCDEPTGNLDAATSRDIQKLIVELSQETGRTFVIVTHDPQVAGLAQRQLKLVDGRLA